MKYLIISFKNRTSLYTFVKILKNYSFPCEIINTPHAVSRSCGLSVKTNFSYKDSIVNIIKSSRFNDIIGIFLVERQGFNERIQRLYWLYLFFLISLIYEKSR